MAPKKKPKTVVYPRVVKGPPSKKKMKASDFMRAPLPGENPNMTAQAQARGISLRTADIFERHEQELRLVTGLPVALKSVSPVAVF